MSTQIIYDFESMGQQQNAVILALAMVAYDEGDVGTPLPELVEKKGVFWKFAASEQMYAPFNRSVDQSTMEWWKKQGQDAIDLIVKPNPDIDKSLHEMPALIDAFCAKHGYNGDGFIWQRGNIDIMWHDSVMDTLGFEVNDRSIKWFKVRDIRTAIDLNSGMKRLYGNIMKAPGVKDKYLKELGNAHIAHHPLFDVAQDIFQMREVGIFA